MGVKGVRYRYTPPCPFLKVPSIRRRDFCQCGDAEVLTALVQHLEVLLEISVCEELFHQELVRRSAGTKGRESIGQLKIMLCHVFQKVLEPAVRGEDINRAPPPLVRSIR